MRNQRLGDHRSGGSVISTMESDDVTMDIRAPSLGLLVTEAPRALLELSMLPPSLPLLKATTRRGDGHAVMVLPGMAADDRSTSPLRCYLRRQGYAPYGWRHGRNIGDEEIFVSLCDRIKRKRRQHGGAKVSLIGWSMGGLYARELAKLVPEDVRLVITLGSPFKGPYMASNAQRAYERLSRKQGGDEQSVRLARPPPVPTTAIFSRHDGIVAWQRCVEKPSEQIESVEVHGSHCGLGHNPLALYVIADRLAQPQEQWQPFKPHGAFTLLYRNPWRNGIPSNIHY
jgi:pimeloyl-ACP methyl ester carboxylesterase